MKKTTLRLCSLLGATLLAAPLVQAQALIIPQIVDGGAWLSTVAVTNITGNQVIASLAFFQDTSGGNTASWNLALQEGSAQGLVLPPGSTVFLHTFGNAPNATVGWGQLTELGSSGSLAAYVIFTARGASLQNGTAPASAAVSRILVPVDNTNSAVTSMAIVNPTSSSETINVGVRTPGGTSQPSAITLPANGHTSFDFPTKFPVTAGASGLVEFYSPSGSFSILALRFQSGAFTTAPVYSVNGPPLIASSSSGSGGGGTAGNIIEGAFSVTKSSTTLPGFPTALASDSIGGQFGSFTPAEWNLPFSAQTFGPCSVFDVTNPVNGKPPYTADNFLDAGTIAVSGPNLPPGAVLTKMQGPGGPSYSFTPSPGVTLAYGGKYTINNGSGGSQIGPFNISATLPDSFSVTNWDAIASINRGNGLTINWTGSGFDTIVISAIGSTTANSNTHTVALFCTITPAAASGSFSVPQDALALLPAVQAASSTDIALLSVTASTNSGGTSSAVSSTSQALTPALVGGGQVNYGFFSPAVTVTKGVSIQ